MSIISFIKNTQLCNTNKNYDMKIYVNLDKYVSSNQTFIVLLFKGKF